MQRLLWLACVGVAAASPLSAQQPKSRDTLKDPANYVTSVAFSLLTFRKVKQCLSIVKADWQARMFEEAA